MKKLLAAIVCLLLLSAPAYAQKTKAALVTEVNVNWPDNTTGLITPALLRSTVIDIINSYFDFGGSSSFTCPNGQFITQLASLADNVICAQTVVASAVDYTASTWTPSLIGSSTPGTGQTYIANGQVGTYEQIGRQVTARFFVGASSLGTANGNLLVSGLPVTSSVVTPNDSGPCSITFYVASALSTSNFSLSGYVIAGTSTVNIVQNGNTKSIPLTTSQAGGSVQLLGVCNYHT